MNSDASQKSNSLSWGLALVGVAAFALYFSQDIHYTGLSSQGGLGPRAFPIGLSLCLLVSGVYQIGHWTVAKLWGGTAVSDRSGEPTPAGPVGRQHANVLIVVAALVVYIPAISWVGYSLSTLIIASALMIRLGTRWWLAVLISMLLVVAITLMFLHLFKVQLPAGTLGLPY